MVLQRAAGPEYRADYHRNFKLIDWRLAPPLPSDFDLDWSVPEMERFEKLCAMWGISLAEKAWRGFGIRRRNVQAAIASVRGILAAAVG